MSNINTEYKTSRPLPDMYSIADFQALTQLLQLLFRLASRIHHSYYYYPVYYKLEFHTLISRTWQKFGRQNIITINKHGCLLVILLQIYMQ